MRLSYNWLKELVNFKESPEKLAELLNMHVANVEKIEKLGEGLDKVIVSEIVEIKPHPNADKLQLVKVKFIIHNSEFIIQVVCGAPNIKVGQKVPLALPGAKLAGGIELKESVIRGVKSEGMLCAEDELGIGPDHTGIYILPPETKIGQSVAKVLGLDDTILEIENKSITHRPDLLGHIGFAREIGACLGQAKMKNKKPKTKNKNKKFQNKNLEIKVDDFRLCPRYMAVIMDSVKVDPSPIWLQNRLRNVGIRPINNIVDITNYVLMEIGQPLHAFDADKLASANEKKQIIVRRAKKGEKLVALDGKEYELNQDDLIIADNKKPVALAGVMGGEYSGVTEKTKTIVIESANFDPVTVRRTSWRLGLRSESVLRFEKGLPINFPEQGINRAIELIQKLAGGKVVSPIYDLKSRSVQKSLKRTKKIKIDFNRINKIIGLKIAKPKILSILKSLGFGVKGLTVEVSVFRPDIEGEQDLVEEIVRIYGCEKIPPQPIVGELKPTEYEKEFILERELRNILVGCGFDEVYNYSFYSEKTIDEIGLDRKKHLAIANPLNPDQEYLRASLIPGLIKNAEKNQKNFSEFRIFEIGNVFNPEEKRKIAGLIYPTNPQLIKGIVELIFDKLGIEENKVSYEERPNKSEISGILVLIDNKVIGLLGHYNQFDFFEIDFISLLKFALPTKKYQPISPYPSVKRDLAFLVDRKITWREICKVIKDINPLIKRIELFDVFDPLRDKKLKVSANLKKTISDEVEDKRFGGKRNLAFHIIYQSDNRTLKAEEIEKIQQEIIKKLKEKFGAELRNF